MSSAPAMSVCTGTAMAMTTWMVTVRVQVKVKVACFQEQVRPFMVTTCQTQVRDKIRPAMLTTCQIQAAVVGSRFGLGLCESGYTAGLWYTDVPVPDPNPNLHKGCAKLAILGTRHFVWYL